jgi:hypothetical protein
MELAGEGWTATTPGGEPWSVRIRAVDGTVLGAGFVVGPGQVLTCARVVAAAAERAASADSGSPVLVEFAGLPGTPSGSASVADRDRLRSGGDEGCDLALLEVASDAGAGRTAPLRRVAVSGGRRVRAWGFPKGAEESGAWTGATVGAGRESGARVELAADPAGPALSGGFSGAAVVDDATGGVLGMVVGDVTGADTGAWWMAPVETILRHLPRRDGVAGAPAVDASLADGDLDPGAGVDAARRLVGWLAGPGRRRVRLVVTGDNGSEVSAALRRVVVLADRELRPPAQDPAIAGAPEGTVPPVGAVDLALDVSHRTVDEVSRRIADRLGLPLDDPQDAVGPVLDAAPEMTLVIAGVDAAAWPAVLIDELLAPLAERGVRLLLSFRRTSSPAWRLAQTLWPDHDRDDGDPAVVRRRLDELAARIAEIAAIEDTLLRRRSKVAMRIAAVPDFPARAMSLRLRLTALRKAATDEDRSWLLPQLDGCEAAAERAVARIGDFEATLESLLSRRAELRRRLEAHRTVAEARGRIDDAVLDRLYQQAHDTLWRAPCDLVFAADLVAHYGRAVAERAPG